MERKSRRLSYILRHHPESIGIKLDEHAYGDVQKTLEALNITIEDLDMIVREDEKQRYSYNGDHTRIRANQGHSIPVNVDLKEVQPPDILYHGTATRFCTFYSRKRYIKSDTYICSLISRYRNRNDGWFKTRGTICLYY